MRRKHWKLLIISAAFFLVAYYKFSNTVNLSEKLPLIVLPENILYGQIEAYHPDIFYMKYGLKFALRNAIIKEEPIYQDDEPKINEYFYYLKNCSKIAIDEREILKNDFAQTYMKIVGHDNVNYLFTMSGDHSGSANLRDLVVRLYRQEHGKYQLVFDKTETYSIDPGIDSNFFTERLKLLIYRKLHLDDRYL